MAWVDNFACSNDSSNNIDSNNDGYYGNVIASVTVTMMNDVGITSIAITKI